MDSSDLPPLFDNMDNVDISSPDETDIVFQSAIQVLYFFVLINHSSYHEIEFLLKIYYH